MMIIMMMVMSVITLSVVIIGIIIVSRSATVISIILLFIRTIQPKGTTDVMRCGTRLQCSAWRHSAKRPGRILSAIPRFSMS